MHTCLHTSPSDVVTSASSLLLSTWLQSIVSCFSLTALHWASLYSWSEGSHLWITPCCCSSSVRTPSSLQNSQPTSQLQFVWNSIIIQGVNLIISSWISEGSISARLTFSLYMTNKDIHLQSASCNSKSFFSISPRKFFYYQACVCYSWGKNVLKPYRLQQTSDDRRSWGSSRTSVSIELHLVWWTQSLLHYCKLMQTITWCRRRCGQYADFLLFNPLLNIRFRHCNMSTNLLL